MESKSKEKDIIIELPTANSYNMELPESIYDFYHKFYHNHHSICVVWRLVFPDVFKTTISETNSTKYMTNIDATIYIFSPLIIQSILIMINRE